MNIETLATGDEIVSGDVIDTNGAYFSQKITAFGQLVSRHGAVPDDAAAISAVLLEISSRADLCVCSGGLGPTEDDLTADVVAGLLGRPVEFHAESLERSRARFEKLGLRFSENNRRSTRVPQGSLVLLNEVGTAPGFSMQLGRCRFYFLPGVPAEYRFFVDQHILPWVEASHTGLRSAVMQFKTLGFAESHLSEKFLDFAELFPDIKVGYRARSPEVWLKLTAEAQTRELALQKLQAPIAEMDRRIGPWIYSRDQREIAEVVQALLQKNAETVATAESCTGGRIGQMLTANSGASEIYLGGTIPYSNAMKEKLLHVSSDTLSQFGAVSAACAREMAEQTLHTFKSTFALATTGIAGPTGATAEKPVGLVYLALAHRQPGGAVQTQVLERTFRGDRARVQKASAYTALEMLRRHLVGAPDLQDGVG